MIVKKFILSAMLMASLLIAAPAQAQLTKEQIKERKELRKATKKQFEQKAIKSARKEAKKLAKEGWTVTPGAIPLDKQLDRSYLMQMEYDADMYPKYIMGEALSIGENYDGAKLQALELAKQNLVNQVQSEVTSLIETSVANQQLSAEEAATITKTVIAGRNSIQLSLGRVLPVIEAYRTLPNKNKEVMVRIAYSGEQAKRATKQAVYDQLGDDAKALQAKLTAIFGE